VTDWHSDTDKPPRAAGVDSGTRRPTSQRPTYQRPRRPLAPQVLHFLAIVLFLLVSYHLTLWLWLKSAPKETAVPNIVGLGDREAKKLLEAAGLEHEVTAEKSSETAPQGTVIGADPAPGRKVKAGRTVSLTLSSGSKWTKVPDVRDMSVDRARALVREAKLVVGRERAEYHPKVPIGYVFGQAPKPADKVARGSEVQLLVSKGPEPEPTVIGSSRPREEVRSTEIKLTVPPGASLQEVRIVVRDRKGEQTVYTGHHQPGETIVRTVSGEGPSIVVQVYLSGIVVEERSI